MNCLHFNNSLQRRVIMKLTLLVSLLAISIGISESLQVVTKHYDLQEINLGPENKIKVAVFSVKFDSDVFLNGIPIANLSLDPASGFSGFSPSAIQQKMTFFRGNDWESTAIPISMVMQMGLISMTCPCIGCQMEGCDGQECTWGSNIQPESGTLPLELIPLPSLADPLYVLASIMVGNRGDLIDSPRISKQMTFSKVLGFFESETASWKTTVSPLVDFSSCKISFMNATHKITDRDEIQMNVSSSQNFTRLRRNCNHNTYLSQKRDIMQKIASLDDASSFREITVLEWNLTSQFLKEDWLGCTELTNSFLTQESRQDTFISDSACYFDVSDVRWQSDPCCNYRLSFSQCCSRKNITMEKIVVSGVQDSRAEQICQTPEKSKIVLKNYAENVEKAQSCTEQMKNTGRGIDLWNSKISFIQQCNAEIFGNQGKAPKCKIDTDCWTECDEKTLSCKVPYQNQVDFLVPCLMSKMDDQVKLYMRRNWNMTVSRTDEDFRNVLKEKISFMGCNGPTAWKYGGEWKNVPVENCENVREECWCQNSQCWVHIFVPGNQSACLLDQSCNWSANLTLDRDSCLAKTPFEFCGECSGGYCRETVATTQQQCQNGRCSTVDGLTEEACNSTFSCSSTCKKCTSRTKSSNHICFEPIITEQDCNSRTGAVFSEGVCQFPSLNTKETCEGADHVFSTCSSLDGDLEACQQCQDGNPFCQVSKNDVLKCGVDVWGTCNTETECQQSGTCDDWDFQNWDNEFCKVASNMVSANCSGVCVMPFHLDFWGNPTCSSFQKRNFVGCSDLSIIDPQLCVTNNGSWIKKAFTRQDCEAHGNGCFEKRFDQPSFKNRETCAECGGSFKSLYNWIPSSWNKGEIKSTEWTERIFGTRNVLSATIDWNELNNQVNSAISQMTRNTIKNQYLCQYSLILSNIEKISCDCGDINGEDCYSSPSFVPLGEAIFFAGVPAFFSLGRVSISSDGLNMTEHLESTCITIQGAPDLASLTGNSENPMRKRAAAPIYVYAFDGRTTGQIIGFGATYSNVVNPVQICADIDESIVVDPRFVTPDFARKVPGSVGPLYTMAMNIPTTVRNGKLCATIQTFGEYYPMMRGDPFTPTSAPTITTSSSTSSSISSSASSSTVNTVPTVQTRTTAVTIGETNVRPSEGGSGTSGAMIVAGLLVLFVLIAISGGVGIILWRHNNQVTYTRIREDKYF